MIIPAALIEGLGFFALVVCLLLALKAPESSSRGTSAESPAAAGR
jgi:hypothetical protein